jgi:hypothetical protein
MRGGSPDRLDVVTVHSLASTLLVLPWRGEFHITDLVAILYMLVPSVRSVLTPPVLRPNVCPEPISVLSHVLLSHVPDTIIHK